MREIHTFSLRKSSDGDWTQVFQPVSGDEAGAEGEPGEHDT